MAPMSLIPMMMTWLTMTQAGADNLVSSFGKAVAKEAAAIKQPIVETATYIGSSQCQNVKKIIGVDYKQVEGANEPDFNELSLEFISREVSLSFNLSSAGKLLGQARGADSDRPLIIFMHGFTDDPRQTAFTTIRKAFVKAGKYDVLALDASSLIKWFYLRATTYIVFIGSFLGRVLAELRNSGLHESSIHLIGHSLGAHISGYAGKAYYNITGTLVGRISGLDPAGPCFSELPDHMRISQNDASFVDVIHTNGGVYGSSDTLGHVDFWPNGGSLQPNCLWETCSHSRVWEMYSESVVDERAFLGLKCKDWEEFKKGKCSGDTSIMGYGCMPGTRGSYYLQTNESSPYGLGEKGLQFENNEAIVTNVGSAVKSLFG